MKWAMILVCSAAAACSAIDIDLAAETGLSYPTGQWGSSLNTGADVGLSASWVINPSFRAGLGFSLSVFGSSDQGAASLTLFKPHLKAAYYLRPWGKVFNPGVVCSFGFCRSSLSNSGGTDPASWDPFWKAGLRWNFSLGAGFRGEVGGDYTSIMAEVENGDLFTLHFGISREVTL
ncbi:MAG: hypothetical protein K8S24_04205 [Candidatus Aegiribacteria sp.]|nr:hypothetical protein [Candidatus Aegiribacteria sp.]